MADVNRGNRPLSPHITIYRFPITAITSILTRATGLAMLVSTALITWWLVAAGTSPEAFARADACLTSFLGDVVMTLSVLGLWYHALAGARHLLWDTGRALNIEMAEKLSWACLIGSVVLTILTIIVI